MRRSNWLGIVALAVGIMFGMTWSPVDAQKSPTQVSVVNTTANPVPVAVTNASTQPITLYDNQPSLNYDVPLDKIFVIEYLNIHATCMGSSGPDVHFRIQVSTSAGLSSLTSFPYTERIRNPNTTPSWHCHVNELTKIYCPPGSHVFVWIYESLTVATDVTLSGYLVSAL